MKAFKFISGVLYQVDTKTSKVKINLVYIKVRLLLLMTLILNNRENNPGSYASGSVQHLPRVRHLFLTFVTLHDKTNHIALDINLRYRPI